MATMTLRSVIVELSSTFTAAFLLTNFSIHPHDRRQKFPKRLSGSIDIATSINNLSSVGQELVALPFGTWDLVAIAPRSLPDALPSSIGYKRDLMHTFKVIMQPLRHLQAQLAVNE